MSQRYAVVTGANKGIGFEICKQLATKVDDDVMVILTSRNVQSGIEAVEKFKDFGLSDKVMFHQLDVSDPVSVAALAEFITTQFGRLDILVNNAAISGITYNAYNFLKAVEQTGGWPRESEHDWSQLAIQTYEMAEECLKTNYYGTVLMTKAVLPLLELSDSARIVNVSSSGGKLELISNEWAKRVLSDIDNLTEDRIKEVIDKFLQDFKSDSLKANGWPTSISAYSVSKVAMNAYTRMIARSHPSVLSNCIHPGYVKTDMTLNTGMLTTKESAEFCVNLALLPDGAPSGLFYSNGVSCPF